MPQSRTDAPDHARQVGGLEDASGTAQAPGRRHGGEIKEKRGEDALFRQGPAQGAGIQRQAPPCIPDSHQRAEIAGRPQGQGPAFAVHAPEQEGASLQALRIPGPAGPLPVEGDDMTEPIADETRSILDGHIVLSRKLAAANHYPAIDVQASVSRVMNAVVDKEHKAAAQALRKILAKYAEVELLVQIGEYKKGADAEADFALGHIQAVNAFLRQGLEEKSSFEETLAALKKVVL